MLLSYMWPIANIETWKPQSWIDTFLFSITSLKEALLVDKCMVNGGDEMQQNKTGCVNNS